MISASKTLSSAASCNNSTEGIVKSFIGSNITLLNTGDSPSSGKNAIFGPINKVGMATSVDDKRVIRDAPRFLFRKKTKLMASQIGSEKRVSPVNTIIATKEMYLLNEFFCEIFQITIVASENRPQSKESVMFEVIHLRIVGELRIK